MLLRLDGRACIMWHGGDCPGSDCPDTDVGLLSQFHVLVYSSWLAANLALCSKRAVLDINIGGFPPLSGGAEWRAGKAGQV